MATVKEKVITQAIKQAQIDAATTVQTMAVAMGESNSGPRISMGPKLGGPTLKQPNFLGEQCTSTQNVKSSS